MKISNAIASVLAFNACPSITWQDQTLSDEVSSNMTGQPGLSIDFHDFSVELGEINYKDEGNLFITGYHLRGARIAQEVAGKPLPTAGASTTAPGLLMWLVQRQDALEAAWGYDGVNFVWPDIPGCRFRGAAMGRSRPISKMVTLFCKPGCWMRTMGRTSVCSSIGLRWVPSDLVAGMTYWVTAGNNTVPASNIVTSAIWVLLRLVIDGVRAISISLATWGIHHGCYLTLLRRKCRSKMHNSRGNDRLVWATAGDPAPLHFSISGGYQERWTTTVA